jgi:hypothetical protein
MGQQRQQGRLMAKSAYGLESYMADDAAHPILDNVKTSPLKNKPLQVLAVSGTKMYELLVEIAFD